MAGMNGLGILALTMGAMVPRREAMKDKLDRLLETGSLEEFHQELERQERPIPGVLASVDFGASPARATPQTGVRTELARSSDARPKGRGHRRREAAARKGKK